MLLDVTNQLYILFSISVIITLVMFYLASNRNNIYLTIALIWISIQTFLGLVGIYTNPQENPASFSLLIPPTIIAMVMVFVTTHGREFMDNINLRWLTLLHTVRIPVEVCLFWLFQSTYIPELMTFEGRNFDIIAGITAPIVYWLYFKKKAIGPKVLLAWNVVMLLFLLNIVVNALLSAPFPFQQFAFDQPNIGILYWPFNLLPSFIVPSVIFSHLIAIRQLVKRG